MSAWRWWLIGAVVCVIIEILPPPTHFFFLCVALGALAASITSFFSSTGWLPWAVFAVTSIALTPMLIPLARFLFTPKPHASNVDALVGEKALVIERIDSKTPGVIKVHGEKWRAFSEETLEKEDWAQIVRVEGAHVVVRRNV